MLHLPLPSAMSPCSTQALAPRHRAGCDTARQSPGHNPPRTHLDTAQVPHPLNLLITELSPVLKALGRLTDLR